MRNDVTPALCATAAPLILVTAALATCAAADRLGWAALGEPPPRNSAEAAAAGDPATMLRMIRFGHDPTRVYPIRAGLISPEPVLATTAEAAVWARQPSVIRLLDEAGAIVGTEERRHLACLAADLRLPDIVDYLAVPANCAAGEALARVAARAEVLAGGPNE